jgi:hypothetical protein
MPPLELKHELDLCMPPLEVELELELKLDLVTGLGRELRCVLHDTS